MRHRIPASRREIRHRKFLWFKIVQSSCAVGVAVRCKPRRKPYYGTASFTCLIFDPVENPSEGYYLATEHLPETVSNSACSLLVGCLFALPRKSRHRGFTAPTVGYICRSGLSSDSSISSGKLSNTPSVSISGMSAMLPPSERCFAALYISHGNRQAGISARDIIF